MSVLPTPKTTIVPSLLAGWHLRGFSTLSGGALAVVGVDADLHAALQSDRASKTVGEVWRLAAQAHGKIWSLYDDQLIEALRFPLLEPFPIVDQFPDGRWLVVNARSNGQGNARLFSVNGNQDRRIELGDGIEHMKIDAQQRIWVGWFDEGVFGNDNWRLPGSKWAPSAHGIAAFDDQGALVAHSTLESIADCYSLNVFGDEAWACTHTDFPIWRMHGGSERVWPTNLRGPRAIAVRYPYLLAAGGYGDEANRVQLLKLEEQSVHALGEWRLPLDDNNPATMIDGRGDELHVVQGQDWHRWRVADFVRSK